MPTEGVEENLIQTSLSPSKYNELHSHHITKKEQTLMHVPIKGFDGTQVLSSQGEQYQHIINQ